MFTKSELSACSRTDINSCNINDLTDITNRKVDITEPMHSRAEKYFEFVKNPYLFRVGDVGVKINCQGNKDFSELIISIANHSK